MKLKFRVLRNTFKPGDLQQKLDLQPLNQIPELPIYGNEPRVRASRLRGPWQEVELRVHAWNEIDTLAFWQFLKQAVESFQQFSQRASLNLEDFTPWKKLGQKWHLARRGFPPDKPVQWPPQVLEQVLQLLQQTAPEGKFLWTNQQVVHLFVPGQSEPWATVWTKRPEAVRLVLTGPKGCAALGRVAQLGREPTVDSLDKQHDVIQLKFQQRGDLKKGDLPHFLQEHCDKAKGSLNRVRP